MNIEPCFTLTSSAKIPNTGTRIRFTRSIIENANESSPEYILAGKGEYGTIRTRIHGNTFSVVADTWSSASFLADLGVDFELVLE